MFVLAVPALSLVADDAGVALPPGADYLRRAKLTATSEQSAPGPDDVRVWFDLPLTGGRMLHNWYFDCPIPTYNQIAWGRERPADAVPTVALSRGLLGDVRERRLDIDDRRLHLLDLGTLAWLLLRIDEAAGEATIDQMDDPGVINFPGGSAPFVRSIARLRDAGWIDAPSRFARSFVVSRGPRAFGEPTDIALEDRQYQTVT